MSDRTAAGIVLVTAGITWIVWYRRLSGAQRDALTRGLSAAGSESSAPAAHSSSSGGGADLQPSGASSSPSGGGADLPGPPPSGGSWRPSWSRPGHTASPEDRFNRVLKSTRDLWRHTFPGVPLPGGDIKPLPTPPIAPSRGGL
jgi:hypothetical protein